MAKNTSITISDHFDQFISDQVKTGRFHSTSEVIRAGLRLLEQQDLKIQNLRNALIASETAPIVDDFDIDDFIARKG